MSVALFMEPDHNLDDDPRFPNTGCPAYVVVFDRRQWCQHGPCHVGLHC